MADEREAEQQIASSDKNDPLAAAIGKYIEVWLFSIQFGALSAVSYSSFNFSSDAAQRWGLLGLPASLAVLGSALVSLMAWAHLARFFSYYLVPKYVVGKSSDNPDEKMEFALTLSRAMTYLIVAIGLRLLGSVVDVALQSVARF
ncbi:hypothetical protein [Rhizobium leguminosarum]|uniref:hypothetical protein n=1 Tax=Rhizobium leguminosarum TaxID=384 RepID=UPI0014422336|nr:hypothetical protein [Rhizobium leguminosarum]MBY5867124.1 hypothetical protein [Rhizobium leguminosarum]NKM02890.1 hypothetical protein [Rhizobium leguminosarum bv. viciae]